ncbi:hypothetical protein BAL199_19863 [alpha proteobacterium BAL199]|jgi:hypothetical protein|nr:hypothetical protein BAL199_19863 [alpha proteobacterium BAL199]
MRALTGLLMLALVACASPQPATDGTGDEAGGVVGSALLVDPPSCVVVMPAEVPPLVGLPPAVAEAALARHLSGRIERVIGPSRRDAFTRRVGLDLEHSDDRRRFADLAGCSHAVASRFWGGRAWGLVWSETQIGVEIAILAFADGRPRWHARRTIRRGDGGLPLSPVSAVVATGLAARTALDGDVLHSVLDDALRAALSDLPDLRDPQAFASRNSSVSPLSSRK